VRGRPNLPPPPQLEGAVASGERRVRQQAEELERLKAEAASLEASLAAAGAQLGATPERCRAAQSALVGDADK
jgi:hypothetical protein